MKAHKSNSPICKRVTPFYRIASSFRDLREAWFNKHLRSYAQERVWEEKYEEQRRIKQNEVMKREFDEDTEAIIRGEKRSLAPTCGHDMWEGRQPS